VSTVRLVVLGGSGTSTPEFIDALSDWPGGVHRRPPLDVLLVGRSSDKLRVVGDACRSRVIPGGPRLTIGTSTARREALQDADLVLNQVRVGGYAARAFDESFPRAFGIPGEETIGPGGFANACRTVPALTEAWDDIATVAPRALVINLTNPAGIVQGAVHRSHPILRVVSVCESPLPMLDAVAARLGRPIAEVRQRYIGMNHMGWYVPESAGELDAIADLATGVDPEVVRLHEALPAPYVRYYVHPDRLLTAQLGRQTRAQALQRLEATLLAGYAAGASDLPLRGAVAWYRMAVIAFVDAWVNGADEPILAATRNGDFIRWLPADAVLELSHIASRPGLLSPLAPVELPPLPRALLAAHASYEVLAAQGAGSGDRTARLRALLANPLVRSVDQAVGIMGAITGGPAS
jgi:6-phospho-beta-glucosidase